LAKAPLPAALDIEATGGVPPFYLTYQGREDRDLQSCYGAHITRVMQALHPHWTAPPPVERPGPEDKVRVGVLSAYFYRHSNWKIPIKGWLEGLDRGRFELYGYHLGGHEDQETETARALCHRFIGGRRHRLADWAETIRADRLHVLLIPGIGMDPLTTRLAALKLAPVQAASWGHPETSGLPSIDHFLSSALMEPPGADAHYTEKLIRLPNLSVAYATLPVEPAPVTRASFGIPAEANFYWCCQSLYKYLPRYDSVFSEIAAADPAACFAFITYPGDAAVTEIFRRRLTAVFAARGLDAEHFCRFLPRLDAAGFAGVTGLADVFLDSIGWSGCNSTFEALDQGVPVVTLPGELMRGRHSAAILTMLGQTGLIAGSVAEYVKLAAALGTDRKRRAALSETIKRDRVRLYNDRACLDGLQRYLEDAAMGRL
jgi:predicted O-linked N-acetylglucosamine transferase (SPINDLY family)